MSSDDTKPARSLDALNVASPCTESWDAMNGGERMRFCAKCSLHVHDLSSMSRCEAEDLVRSRRDSGQRLCVRFVRDASGAVVTDERGTVRRIVDGRVRRVRAAAVAAFALVLPLAACRQTLGTVALPADNARPASPDGERQRMGDVCAPQAPRVPSQAPTPAAPPPAAPSHGAKDAAPHEAPAPSPDPAPPQRDEVLGRL